MTESYINWRVGPDDAEWDLSVQSRLDAAEQEARKHFEEVAGRPLWSGPQADDSIEIANARQKAVDARMAAAQYQRLGNDPVSQRRANQLETTAWKWQGSDKWLKAHGMRQAAYWTNRIFELFGPFGSKKVPGRAIAHEALRLIIRHCTVCPSCDAISYHKDSPGGREKKCDVCRRWDRRLKPYPSLLSRWDFAALLRAQGGKCALCTESDPPVPEGALDGWHIDHDHATGRVRGILCPSCNAKVGRHESDRDWRVAIEDYLRR